MAVCHGGTSTVARPFHELHLTLTGRTHVRRLAGEQDPPSKKMTNAAVVFALFIETQTPGAGLMLSLGVFPLN